MKKIILTTGSMTYAIKARKLLLSDGIQSKLIKIDHSESSSGCTHGIEIRYSDFFAAVGKLKSSNLPYSVYKK